MQINIILKLLFFFANDFATVKKKSPLSFIPDVDGIF